MSGQCQAPASLPLGKDSVPIVQEAGWAPGPVWTSAESLAPTGIQSPDRPARSQSLYRLRYPHHQGRGIYFLFNITGWCSGIALDFYLEVPG